jgi:deoxyuridine 5'-triphosphate nucleotidohydrolase
MASNHYDKYKQIYSTTPPPNPPPTQQPNQQSNQRNNQRQHRPPPNNPQRPQQPSPNYNPPPTYQAPAPAPPAQRPYVNHQQQPPPTFQPRPPSPYIRNEAEVQRIRSELQTSANPTSTIHHLHQSQPHNCSLHSGAPHPIINCGILRNICNQTNTFEVLNNARNDLQLAPMPSTGLLPLPPRQYRAPSPAPSPAPVPNPYLRPPAPAPTTNPWTAAPAPSPVPNPYSAQPPAGMHYPPQAPTVRQVQLTESQEDPNLYVQDSSSIHFQDDTEDMMVTPIQRQAIDPEAVEINYNRNELNHYFIRKSLCSILHKPDHLRSNNNVSFAPSTNFHKSSNLNCHPSNVSTSSPSPECTTNPTPIRAVCDSGASHTMTNELVLFDTITYFNENDTRPSALMGDDTTKLDISGYGYITYSVHDIRIRQFAYYVPKLGTTLLSIKQHVKSQGCYFHVEAKSSVLAFPTFILSPRIHDEIDLMITPATKSTIPISFNEATSNKTEINQQSTSTTTSRIQSHNSTSIPLIPTSVKQYITQPTLQQQFIETVHIKKLIPTAQLPKRATPGSIGYDIASISNFHIDPGDIAVIPTGLASALPAGMYLRIAPRSSLSLKHVTVEGGVIDSDYRDEIKILLKNNGLTPIHITQNQRIAQFIFERAATPYLQFTNSLPPTSRTGGLGSTNITTPSSTNTTYQTNPGDLVIINNNTKKHYKVRRVSRPPLTPKIINPNNNLTITSIRNDPMLPTEPKLSMSHKPIDPNSHIHPSPFSTSPSTTLPCDSVNSAQAKVVTMPKEQLLQSIGFRKPDNLLKHMKTLASTPISIRRDNSPRIDPGEVASMKASRRNTTPSNLPQHYSDIWHLDIGFGPCTAIGGIKYTLLAVDKKTRYKLVYGLKNLKSSLLAAIKSFVVDTGVKPKLLRTDFDKKLIGGDVASFLRDSNIPIEASPPYRQHQNGLVESHWQSIVTMSRNWLTSAMLPTKYWHLAIKRACEVSNVLPTNHTNTITTPHELVYNKKVDYRVLFPMFSIAYIKYLREGGTVKDKWAPQSLKCIVVGTCNKSDGLLFYHPPSKQLITCGNGYKFDPFSPSGPQFDEKFDGTFTFHTGNIQSAIHRPPTFELTKTVYFKSQSDPSKYEKGTILSQPVDDDTEPYTVHITTSGNIIQLLSSQLLHHNPSSPATTSTTQLPFPHLPWIQHNSKATLYMNDRMQAPKQGRLIQNNTKWSFQIGRKLNNDAQHIPLDNFDELAESMVHNKKLFRGWKTHNFVTNARHARATSNIVSHLIHARKVSAANLHNMQAPTLLNHKNLHPDDKITWDAAYLSEYNGLVNIDTWDTITESEYQSLKHLYKGIMPTMAISTIKYDGNGVPNRAKYRIVALGNLDPNSWTKQDCFAPVLSQMELRFLTALAVRKKCIPKTGDVTQAFCQSSLPPEEHYICRPPPGCPITPPKTYWRLKKTLYGLKRSPRHFYELARKILLEIGLVQHPSSPCIFHGTLIPGEPPLYLGLYVDDFIYFSESKKVEEHFEKEFGDAISTDFNGQIGYFLGINFTCKRHDDGHVTIHLGQEAFVENLCEIAGLDNSHVTPVQTPYRSGCPVDSIKPKQVTTEQQSILTHKMQVLLGCLTWLSISTRPDISTITNLLAQYTHKATQSHINQARRVVRYLKSTKSLGISFNSNDNNQLESYVKFPISKQITALCDANWGPQDQSKPVANQIEELELFKSRSLSGFIIFLGGPVHWVSKRQTITARSSAEAEIYATDECTKCLLNLHQIVDGLDLTNDIMTSPTTIYNDNSACVNWTKNMTTKGLRHIQIRENSVRESYQNGFIIVEHIPGKKNLSDMFTKEDKDNIHFIEIRNEVMTDRHSLNPNNSSTTFFSSSQGGC